MGIIYSIMQYNHYNTEKVWTNSPKPVLVGAPLSGRLHKLSLFA